MKYSLILLCACLIGLIFYQLKYYANSEYILPPIDISSSEANIDFMENQLGIIDDYDSIIERPLFSIDRRPPNRQSQIIEASVNIDELDELIIYGVVKSGDVAYAIIGNMEGESNSKQVKPGINYKGWRISQITTNSVVFKSDDLEYELFITPGELDKSGSVRRAPNSQQQQGQSKLIQSRHSESNQRESNSTEKKQIISSGGLIYNRAKNTSPIKIPRSNQLGNQTKRTPEELEALREEGGYSFDLDDTFNLEDIYDDDYDER